MSCIYEEDCGPDLSISQEEYLKSIYLDSLMVNDPCLISEKCVTGNGRRDIIRFTTLISNIGETDYIVGNPDINPLGFSIENCHEHWHRLGYAEYLLYQDDGQPVPLGFKNGFCLLDIACTSDETTPKYYCDYMGISAGCFDIYDASVECQWLDVTDVPDGKYTMVARINWNRIPDLLGRQEKTYENNWAQACISLDRSSGQLELIIRESCEEYKDCNGEAYGPATVDCAGICGGISHYGDINQDFVLDSLDFATYLDYLSNGGIDSSPCIDLDGSGYISIYDAILLRECLVGYDENNPLHNHCLFPNSIIDIDNEFDIAISDHDRENREVTLSYSSSIDLNAIQIKMEGINRILNFSQVQINNSETISNYNNEIFIINHEEKISTADVFQDLLTFKYDSLLFNEICISNITDIVTYQNQKIDPVKNSSICDMTTSTNEAAKDGKVEVYPNPAYSEIFISTDQDIRDIKVYDINGIKLIDFDIDQNQSFFFNINDLPKGLYWIKLEKVEGFYYQKFVKS